MSLSESAVKTARCPKCDAEVRDGSLFCYNCGGRVDGEAGSEAAIDSQPAANERPVEISPVVVQPSTKPAPGLRSARDIRRRERPSDRKPREVVWEASSAEPDLQLIILTAAIIVFTIVVVLMVLYVR